MRIWNRDYVEATLAELGGQLVDETLWRESGDEIEESIFRVGVRLQSGMRDGFSIYLKENFDDPEAWRSVTVWAHPEVETMTSAEKFEWIVAHPTLHDDTYLNSLVQWMERFLASD